MPIDDDSIIRDLYTWVAASAQQPTPQDLEPFTPSDRTTIRAASREIVELRAAGHHGPARRAAREAADKLTGRITTTPTTDDATPTDPAELAKLIRRHA